eukprot:bmy_17240T0
MGDGAWSLHPEDAHSWDLGESLITPLGSQLVAVTDTLTAVTSTRPCTWRACVTAAGTTPRASTAIAADPFSTGTPSRPSRILTRAFVSPQPLTRPLPSSEQTLMKLVSLGPPAHPGFSGVSKLPSWGWELQNRFGCESFSLSEQVGPGGAPSKTNQKE